MSGTVSGLAGLSPLALAMLGQQVMPQQSPGTLQGPTMPFASIMGQQPQSPPMAPQISGMGPPGSQPTAPPMGPTMTPSQIQQLMNGMSGSGP